METSPLALCLYCKHPNLRTLDKFCCEGCEVLFEASHQISDTTDFSAEEDLRIVQSFGHKIRSSIQFECYIDPLVCEACMQSLAQLPTLVPGLFDLRWERQTSVLSFQFSEARPTPTYVFNLLKKLNLSPRWKMVYSSSKTSSSPALLRLGVTGALAGNMMLFSIPIYGGLTGSLRIFFEVIQFILFIPVLTWSALPFYKTALTSWRLRHLSLDLPLTVAFLAGSLFSIFSLARGEHDIYFDSLAGFLFLILSSRYLLETSLTKFLTSPTLDQFFEKPIFEIQRDGQSINCTWKEIQKGDIVHLKREDRLPTDGLLTSPQAHFEMAWMTGESTPYLRLYGSQVNAGAVLLSDNAFIEVLSPTIETQFAKLLSSLKPNTTKLQSTTESKVGSLLVLACVLCVIGLFALGSSLGTDEILRRSIALFIVACPCAISFAAPLARARASRLAFKKGFWIRDTHVWDKLLSVKKIAFDKTGTLMSGKFVMSGHSPIVDTHWKKIILSLENISSHPIAESLRRMWGPHELYPVQNAKEVFGKGVEGRIYNHLYSLSSSRLPELKQKLELVCDGQVVCELVLDEVPFKATHEVVNNWSKKHDLFILSGDQQERVSTLGRDYGFKEKNCYGNLSPEQKLEKIEKLNPDLYFGDGTNDLLALKKAPVSVAVAGSCLEAQAASDIVMIRSELKSFNLLFKLAHTTRQLNLRNFGLALAYNLGAGGSALAGIITPLEAAILMPVASIVLLASTLIGTKRLRRLERL